MRVTLNQFEGKPKHDPSEALGSWCGKAINLILFVCVSLPFSAQKKLLKFTFLQKNFGQKFFFEKKLFLKNTLGCIFFKCLFKNKQLQTILKLHCKQF